MMQGQNPLLKMNKTKSKKIVDPEDDDWKCKNCGCPAKHTPLKRTGRDGKKSICNACYIRERTQQERAERGSARPVLTTSVPMTTANILSNPQQNYFFPYWNLANLSMVQQQMNMLTKLGQIGVDNQQLYANNAFGLTQDAVSAALQAYQAAAAATASGQLPVDYNSNLNMLGALGTLGLTAAATTQAANAANVLSGQEIDQSVQDIQQSEELSEELKTDEDTSKQDLQQQIQQITSSSISDITKLAAAVADADTIDKLNKTTALLTESLYDQQAVAAAAVAALDQAQLNLKNDELIKEKINKEIKSIQEAQLRKTEETTSKVETKEEKKIFQKRKEMDEEENLLGEKIKKELKRVKVDSK
ncbi:hypothetical protein BCR36DRAFT_329681 [Piromyces finnis]|uniref:GATA-type domain-containing protein n=1 Tax=Piromyces finnis TaxID=1754191 RepID=A0A1Y1V625_9FUNG|nr:hypothetical protein BCR36DRAFT_329681 [Piromyces finnis]|eukprot:ORX48111.1 hypothetical protein BCR36DRAFT_329681 [Piromyces finnis]